MPGGNACLGEEEAGTQGVVGAEGGIGGQFVEGGDGGVGAFEVEVEAGELEACFEGAAAAFFRGPGAEVGRRVGAEFPFEGDPALHIFARGQGVGCGGEGFAQDLAGAGVDAENEERAGEAETGVVADGRREFANGEDVAKNFRGVGRTILCQAESSEGGVEFGCGEAFLGAGGFEEGFGGGGIAGGKLQLEEQAEGVGVGGERRAGGGEEGAGGIGVALLGADAGEKEGGFGILRGEWFGQFGGLVEAALGGEGGGAEENGFFGAAVEGTVEGFERIGGASGRELGAGEEETE